MSLSTNHRWRSCSCEYGTARLAVCSTINPCHKSLPSGVENDAKNTHTASLQPRPRLNTQDSLELQVLAHRSLAIRSREYHGSTTPIFHFWLDWDPWGAGSWDHALGAASEVDPALQLTECAAGGRAWSPVVVLSMWPCKNISHIQVLFTFSCNFTHSIETETANRWETTNSKPPGRIIMIGQSETQEEEAVRWDCIYYTLLYHSFVAPFTSLSKVCKHAGAKIIFLRQTGMFWLFYI
jgi:hypothetical protein